MSIEMDNQDVSGFAGDAFEGTRSEQPAQSGAVSSPPSADARPDDQSDAAEEVSLDFEYDEDVPGFETSASNCLNRALQIARSLNHMSLSADHLMLALAMDPSARRLLERVGDIVQLREAATQRLGRMHCRFTTGDSFPSQTSDLVDIRKAAREAASEREQLVAISDLINAFPKANGRLTYGSGDGSKAVVLMERIEQGLVPRSRGHDKNRSGGAGGHPPLPVRPVPSAGPKLEAVRCRRAAADRTDGANSPAGARSGRCPARRRAAGVRREA